MAEKQFTLSNPESWLDQYGDYLYRYAFVRVNNTSAAEDILQETLVGALKARDNFQGTSSEKTWLTGILKHKIIDHFRKNSRELSLDALDAPDEAIEKYFNENGTWKTGPARWETSPTQAFEQKEFMAVFQKCLSGLSKKTAENFLLKEINGESTEKVCKVLNISATNSWVLLHRARLGLRACLEKKWFKPS